MKAPAVVDQEYAERLEVLYGCEVMVGILPGREAPLYVVDGVFAYSRGEARKQAAAAVRRAHNREVFGLAKT